MWESKETHCIVDCELSYQTKRERELACSLPLGAKMEGRFSRYILVYKTEYVFYYYSASSTTIVIDFFPVFWIVATIDNFIYIHKYVPTETIVLAHMTRSCNNPTNQKCPKKSQNRD